MENPSGLMRCSVDPVARASRPAAPVFWGISGSTRTMFIGRFKKKKTVFKQCYNEK
jgi:hypothetical protein